MDSDLQARLQAFKRILEAVLEEPVSDEMCAEIVLARGLDVMLAEVFGDVGPDVLLTTLQQLAARYPNEVYGFVADVWQSGDAIEREKAKKRLIGFAPPETAERKLDR